MKKNFLNNTGLACLFCFSLFFLPACKTTQKTVTNPVPVNLPAAVSGTLLDSVLAHQVAFHFLSAKASVSYVDHNNDETSFSVTLRAAKDSLIWISVTPLLGIEAARVLISRDSVHLLDRLHHTLVSRDYRFLEDMLKTHVDFQMLQSMLVGNYFSGTGKPILSETTAEMFYLLSTLPAADTPHIAGAMYPGHSSYQDYWIDNTFRIAKTKIQDDSQQRSLAVDYGSFQTFNNSIIPTTIRIAVTADKPARIAIDYARIGEDPSITFPFYVPEKYTRE
jgi:hypothetical protein